MNDHQQLHPLFRSILSEYIAPEAPTLRVGERCQVLVAVSRGKPEWTAGIVESVRVNVAGGFWRVRIRTDDGRLLPACRADFTRAIVTDVEPT